MGIDPFKELVLGDRHSFADLQGGEAFASHEVVSLCTGYAQDLGNIISIQCKGQLIVIGVGDHFFSFLCAHFLLPFIFFVIQHDAIVATLVSTVRVGTTNNTVICIPISSLHK